MQIIVKEPVMKVARGLPKDPPHLPKAGAGSFWVGAGSFRVGAGSFCPGLDSFQAAAGPPGADGAQGPQGPEGPPGPTAVIVDQNDPGGADGTIWIRPSDGNVAVRVGAGWDNRGSMKGLPGDSGPEGAQGPEGPQ